jgi:hypothetical protein
VQAFDLEDWVCGEFRAQEALRTEQRWERAKQRPEAQRPSWSFFPHHTLHPPRHGAEIEINDGSPAVADLCDVSLGAGGVIPPGRLARVAVQL